MRANDQIAADRIQELETDNDHLRAELDVLREEYTSLKAAYDLMMRDREAVI